MTRNLETNLSSKPADKDDAPIWAASLLRDGYCIIPDVLAASRIASLDADLALDFERTPFCEGGFYGETTKRFGRLLSRSGHAATLVQHELILGIAERLLLPWCDSIQLNVTQAIAVHPGAPPQMPHRDQDMWRGPVGEIEYLVNVIWPLTEFRADNGATLLWPSSHGANALEAETNSEPVCNKFNEPWRTPSSPFLGRRPPPKSPLATAIRAPDGGAAPRWQLSRPLAASPAR